jgi:hypothetical protein
MYYLENTAGSELVSRTGCCFRDLQWTCTLISHSVQLCDADYVLISSWRCLTASYVRIDIPNTPPRCEKMLCLVHSSFFPCWLISDQTQLTPTTIILWISILRCQPSSSKKTSWRALSPMSRTSRSGGLQSSRLEGLILVDPRTMR